jgi:hypothetical protein
MSAAMFAYALGILSLPVFDVLRSRGANELAISPVYYLAAAPFFIYFVLYFLGVRKIAAIMSIKSRLLNIPFVCGGALVVGLAVSFIPLPHVNNGADAQVLHIIVGLVGVGLSLLGGAMVLLFRLMRSAGVLYRPAFRWNFYGFLAFFITQVLDPSAFLPPHNWYVTYGTTMPFLITVACFIKAAVEFNRIPYREQNLQVEGAVSGANPTRKTSVDVVISLAQLVSNPRAVDANLDKLRVITSRLAAGAAPSEIEQTQLADLCKMLEDYLVQKEQARTYTSEDLRQLIDIQFHGSVDEPVFWRELSL